MPLPPRVRLDPDVFRLPVERLRDGYYADAYFVYTKQLLEHSGHHPQVLMQVFQKQESLLGGIDEAIAIVKLGAGRLGTNGEWTPGWEQLQVHALYEGDAVSPWETVMTIEGDYSLFSPYRPATVGRRTWPARSASPPTRRPRGGAGAASAPCRTG
jgi:nicotinate phosphoribosyltransferase